VGVWSPRLLRQVRLFGSVKQWRIADRTICFAAGDRFPAIGAAQDAVLKDEDPVMADHAVKIAHRSLSCSSGKGIGGVIVMALGLIPKPGSNQGTAAAGNRIRNNARGPTRLRDQCGGSKTKNHRTSLHTSP